jgi:hypothetical protein
MRTHRIGKIEVDQPRLLKELEQIAHFEFAEAYSNYLCGGPWKSCMLWSIGGDTGDGLVTNYDYDKPPAKTRYAEQLPYLMEVIEQSFNLEYMNFARLAVISNSVIIPHKDLLELGNVPERARNVHRVHVPLVTNENCYFLDGNVVYRMRFGEVWFFDASSMHSAASFSEQERVHLMLDFSEVDDPGRLVKFRSDGREEIPQDSICARGGLTDAERESLMSLASVIDADNFKDIFSIVIKKHYRKDGGDNFIWDTVMKIASSSRDRAVDSKIRQMHEYFMVQRSA